MGIIYKITNTLDNKIYVGQTTRNIAERWREHKSKSAPSDGTYLHNAIAKYGEDNFVIEEIDTCSDDELNNREIEWITILDTMYPNGYNLTKGGEGNSKINHSQVVALWEEGKSLGDIANIMSVSITTIGRHLRGHPSYSTKEAIYRARGGDFSQNKLCKGINQYTWDGKFVKHYENVYEIFPNKKDYRISHLQYACRGNQVLWNNYQWRYDTEPAPAPVEKPAFCRRRIAQFSLDGEYIQTFPSAAAAAREVSPT